MVGRYGQPVGRRKWRVKFGVRNCFFLRPIQPARCYHIVDLTCMFSLLCIVRTGVTWLRQ